MTDKQKNQREEAFRRSCGYCYICHKPLYEGQMQAAHKITNNVTNREKYGSFFIDHTLNVEYTCSLECNADVDFGNNEGKKLGLLAEILTYEIKRFKEGRN